MLKLNTGDTIPDLSIDTIFQYDDIIVQVSCYIPSDHMNSGCNACAFNHDTACISAHCTSKSRTDNTSVYFKEVNADILEQIETKLTMKRFISTTPPIVISTHVTKKLKINEQFILDDSIYVVVDASHTSSPCSFCNLRQPTICANISCIEEERHDGKHVYFKKV